MLKQLIISQIVKNVKTGSTFSSYLEFLRGFPHGSILEPNLFDIFLNDLMFFINEIEVYNFGDDTTLYSYSLNYR